MGIKKVSLIDQINNRIFGNLFIRYGSIFLLAFLITIPVFLFVRENFEYLNLDVTIEKVILFIAIFLFYFSILLVLRKFITISFLIYLIIFITATLEGNYAFFKVVNAYKILFYKTNLTLETNENPQHLIPFPNKNNIEESVDYLNPKVRDFALFSINKHYKELAKLQPKNRRFIQYFAVFREINERWNYVNDPRTDEYFAKASESLKYFSGDCDDHAILMSATIKAIGGRMRLIHTGKHMYPELFIGKSKDLEQVVYLIKNEMFPHSSKNKSLFIHRENNGSIWLNMDYTAHYPGGPFLGEEILSILTLDQSN